MQAARIKRGATFRSTITFEADEWAAIYPWTAVEAKLKQGSRETVLAVAIDLPNMRLTLSATPTQTALWVIQPGSFDVKITRAGGEVLKVPASENIPILVIEGIT